MDNQIDGAVFGATYLDFNGTLTESIELLYGGERVLGNYTSTKEGFILEDRYNGRNLRVTASGNVEKGVLRIRTNGEETECDYSTEVGGSSVNFAVQLRKLELNPLLIAKIGQDKYGDRVRGLLQKRCKCYLLRSNANQTLSINLIHPETREGAYIVTGDSNRDLQAYELMDLLPQLLGSNKFLYAGGFFKLRQLFGEYPEIFRKVRDSGCKVILDHGRFLSKAGSLEYEEALSAVKNSLQYVTIYLPNDAEITELTGRSDLGDALRSARELGPELIVCKTGANGCSFVTSDGKVYHVRQEREARHIVHTVGAGDSFNAGFIKGLKSGLDVESAGTLGNTTAFLRITTGKYPTYEDVKQLLSLTS